MPTERATVLQRLSAYGGFAVAAVVVLVWGQRLDHADLRVPLYYSGDSLLILPLIQATIERGSHWRNERLGAPGIQELHDFPIVDHFHFALIWLLGQVIPDAAVVFNLYHLLTYPLTVLTTMIVLRGIGVSLLSAGMAGMLYAILPFHYIRGLGHYFLSAYYTLPISLWPALAVMTGRSLGGSKRNLVLNGLIAVMTASAGAYYAFFTCLVLAFVGVSTAVRIKSWKPLLSLMIVIAAIVAAGIVNHLPAILYQAELGRNSEPTRRQPEEAETYGLKLPQMLLPTPHHRLRVLSNLRAMYDTNHRPLQNENETATLGLIGSLGFISLMVIAILPLASGGRQPPDSVAIENQGTHVPRSPVGAIASLVLFLTLYGLIGGLGSLFNFLVTPQVRSLNRISIVIAFFVFVAVAFALDHVLRNRNRFVRVAVIVGLTVFGIFDETTRDWFRRTPPSRQHTVDQFRQDAAFFRQIEDRISGGMVFCLPFVPYPESPGVGGLGGYDHARGYLHSRSLRFSFGAMKGREIDQWQRDVAILPVPEMVELLIYRGFDGVFVDTRGFSADSGKHLVVDLTRLCGSTAMLIHDDGSEYFFDLRDQRRRVIERLGDAEYGRRADVEANRVRVLWLDGFVSFAPVGSEADHRWCGPTGSAVIVNPSNAVRRVSAEMIIRSSIPMTGELTIDGGSFWPSTMAISDSTAPLKRDWLVEPGRHAIRFRFRPAKEHVPMDARNLAFFIAFFRLTESP